MSFILAWEHKICVYMEEEEEREYLLLFCQTFQYWHMKIEFVLLPPVWPGVWEYDSMGMSV